MFGNGTKIKELEKTVSQQNQEIEQLKQEVSGQNRKIKKLNQETSQLTKDNERLQFELNQYKAKHGVLFADERTNNIVPKAVADLSEAEEQLKQLLDVEFKFFADALPYLTALNCLIERIALTKSGQYTPSVESVKMLEQYLTGELDLGFSKVVGILYSVVNFNKKRPGFNALYQHFIGMETELIRAMEVLFASIQMESEA